MSRLIDAEALIEVLQTKPEYLIKTPQGFEAIVDLIGNHHKKVIEVIEQQPTAYDVDKVVEELEKGAYTTTDTVCGGLFEAIRLSSAIEIVRKGGVEHG